MTLTANTNRVSVDLSHKNLRIVLHDDYMASYYAFEKGAGAPCSTQSLGVDKGYTDTLADSDGHFHGRPFQCRVTN